jgi:hypothetical protein
MVGLVVWSVASYITHIFKMLGPIFNDSIGFAKGTRGGSREQVLGPILNALMEFRSDVCDKARSHDLGSVLGLCDTSFHDKLLPPLCI